MKKGLLFISILSILFGCGNENPQNELSVFKIKSSFDQPFPKRKKNITQVLGNSFSIKQDNDTINYKVLFNNTTKQNFIIEEEFNDTIFSGTICKYRGLYYFNEEINDTTFWISALKIKNGTIKGLQTSWVQMYAWDKEFEFYPTNFIQKPLTLKYIDTTNNIIRLTPIKKEMRLFYEKIIDSLSTDTLINWEDPITDEMFKKDSSIINNSISHKIYPNPAKNNFTIELKNSDYYSYSMFDENGYIGSSGKLTQQLNTINISNLKSGTYFIKIYNSEKEISETQKLIVKK